MFVFLLVLFVIIPTIEMSLLIQVGSVIGVFPTIFLVFLTAVVGATLVKSQGLQTLTTARERLEKGETPAEQVIEGLMIALAGVLLITPGFFTDTLGMVFLLPWPRKWIAKKIQSSNLRFNSRFSQSAFTSKPQQGNVFDGEFERKNDDQNRLN